MVDTEVNAMFLTEESFFKTIANIVVENNFDYIEAIVFFCEENDLDIEEIIPLINRTMKEKIKVSAEDKGLVKREARLPI